MVINHKTVIEGKIENTGNWGRSRLDFILIIYGQIYDSIVNLSINGFIK
jgi:hypothetical protein